MTWGAFKHENVTQFARPVFLDDFEPANAPPAASTLGLFEISFFELITFRVLLSNSICSPSVENYKNLWYFVDVTVIKTFLVPPLAVGKWKFALLRKWQFSFLARKHSAQKSDFCRKMCEGGRCGWSSGGEGGKWVFTIVNHLKYAFMECCWSWWWWWIVMENARVSVRASIAGSIALNCFGKIFQLVSAKHFEDIVFALFSVQRNYSARTVVARILAPWNIHRCKSNSVD